MANPTNCFICKNTWLGKGPICDQCNPKVKPKPPPPPPSCGFCGGSHDLADCLLAAMYFQKQAAAAAALHQQQWAATMATRTRSYNPYAGRGSQTVASNYQRLKTCPTCKGNYVIESKAGSVCSSCKTVIHNPCRNCSSPNTRGLSAPDDNLVPGLGSVQYIECQDCLFIE